MKKATIKKIALAALPLAAVAVAIAPGSVKVYDGGAAKELNFLTPVEGPIQGLAAPTAALLNYAAFALVVIWLFRKKKGWLKAIAAVSLAASCFAVAPMLFHAAEMLIIPNFVFPLLLLAEAVLAYTMALKPDPEEEARPNGRRLDVHE